MVVTENDPSEITTLQRQLTIEFELKNLGNLKSFLGIEVARSFLGISLCQQKYGMDLLIETCMLDHKLAKTPIEVNHRLSI